MFKNVASQKVQLFAFDRSTGQAKVGDAANITAYVSKDHGSVTVLGDTSATEMDSTNAKGVYVFDLTQGETNADELTFTAKSSTSNIEITPRFISTVPPKFTTMVIDSAGLVDATAVKVGPSGSATAQTAGDVPARLPAALVGGRMDASTGAMAANVLTATAINADAFTAAKFAADVTTELQTGLATASALATLDGKVDVIDGNVDAILLDTAEIGAAGAGLTALASQSSVDTIDGNVDAILLDTAEIGSAGAGLTTLASASGQSAIGTLVLDLPTNAELATALAAADDATLAAIGALSIPTAVENADAILRRQAGDVDDSGGTRDLLAVIRMVRNGFKPITGTDLEVLKEDDSTVAWTRTLTTDPAAEPIVGVGGP